MRAADRTFLLGELVERLGGILQGDRNRPVHQVASLDTAGPDDIAYFADEAYRSDFEATGAGAVVVHPGNAHPNRNCILTDAPQVYFIRLIELFHPQPEPVPGVHASAWVHPQAQVAPTAEIGAFASVDAGATIGERVRIGPGCRIGAHAVIGESSHLHANVTLYPSCIVGRRAVLNAGCVIGSDGFGGTLHEGRWLKIPHIGRVVLGDDVEVGANTTIDRGALSDTLIADGVKLDNQIQIAHNVRIGAHTSVAACAGIAGSAHIGERCVIGGNSSISGHLRLTDGVYVSPATMIGRSIDKPGRYTGIFPWTEHRAWLRLAAALRRLSESAGPGRARTGARKTTKKEEPTR
jgi:UDP-3-O-[3-hydroxymyristoyl] glucosamine N-acyltransferase